VANEWHYETETNSWVVNCRDNTSMQPAGGVGGGCGKEGLPVTHSFRARRHECAGSKGAVTRQKETSLRGCTHHASFTSLGSRNVNSYPARGKRWGAKTQPSRDCCLGANSGCVAALECHTLGWLRRKPVGPPCSQRCGASVDNHMRRSACTCVGTAWQGMFRVRDGRREKRAWRAAPFSFALSRQ
jgi:hypothetical protein